MLKKLLTILSLVALLSASGFAQSWVNQGNFPQVGDVVKGSTHGIAVDGEGKIWVTNYYADGEVVTAAGDTVACRTLRVYNPDGTPASFSPITTITVSGVTDTLFNSSRGLNADHEGNILYTTGGPELFRINHLTGEGMNKTDLAALATSPTAPAVDDNGNIYIAPVVPGNPIVIYDANFNFLGNAVDATTGFARSMTVSADGNTIYHPGYSIHAVHVYERPDEFSSYDSTGQILKGFDAESIGWDPKSGALWASAGSANDMPNRYEGVTTYYSANTWYGYNVTSGSIIDSMKWTMIDTVDDASERPRGIAFSPDGNTAYVGCFGTNALPAAQYLTRDLTPQDVTFKVNMSVAVANNNFTPGTDVMNLAGSFNEWSTSANPMTDADNDNIWETVVSGLEPGTRLYFKFVKNSDGWENDPNREYVVKGGNNMYEAYYNDDLGGGIEVVLFFQADMEVEKLSGRFNPSTDTMTVRGGFNGWSGDDIMTPSATNTNLYEFETTFQVNPGDDINYKFAYVSPSGTTWENGADRIHTVTQDDINAGFIELSRAFNDAGLESVTKYESELVFQVDMTNAVDLNGQAFSSLDNVAICGAIAPLAWPQGGWPDEDSTLVHFLNDAGVDGDTTAGDNIWSVTLTFPQYTLLSFEYKYGANWGLASNNGTNDNESGTGVNHSVTLPNEIIFGRTNDVWADMSPTTLTGVITDVREVNSGIPSTFSLDQNYPNPFNPTTTIRFNLPEASNVVVKIYDMLGQEVQTLVNEELTAGSYDVSFDASRLTSGMYIYSIQAGEFSMTRKMMLLK